MKDLIDLLKEYLPVSAVLILIVFSILILVIIKISRNLIKIAEKEKEASKNQSEYLSQRISSIESILNIENMAFQLQEKQLNKIYELSEEQEKNIEFLIKEKQNIKAELEKTESELEEQINTLNLKENQINTLNSKITKIAKREKENTLIGLYHEIIPTITVIRNISDSLFYHSKPNDERIKNRKIKRIWQFSQELTFILYGYRVLENKHLNDLSAYYLFENIQLIKSISEIVNVLKKDSKLAKFIDINIISNVSKSLSIHTLHFNFLNLIYQLLKNAIKYSVEPEVGSVEIIIDENDDFVNISIKNRSFHISEEEIGLLFNKGFRAKNVGNTEGLGNGLYIAKQLAITLNGEIGLSVNKINNKVSEFTFLVTLPKEISKKG